MLKIYNKPLPPGVLGHQLDPAFPKKKKKIALKSCTNPVQQYKSHKISNILSTMKKLLSKCNVTFIHP